LLSPADFDPGSIIQFIYLNLHERFSEVFHNKSDILKILLLLLLNLAVKGSKSVNYSVDLGFQILLYTQISLGFYFLLTAGTGF